jgi:hypothetical protein
MLDLDFMSPKAAAAADLTSGLSSTRPFSASFRALLSLGIKPRTRMAVARSPVLCPLHPVLRICQASSKVCRALGAAVVGWPAPACGGAEGFCAAAPGEDDEAGLVGFSCAGELVCGGEAGVAGC